MEPVVAGDCADESVVIALGLWILGSPIDLLPAATLDVTAFCVPLEAAEAAQSGQDCSWSRGTRVRRCLNPSHEHSTNRSCLTHLMIDLNQILHNTQRTPGRLGGHDRRRALKALSMLAHSDSSRKSPHHLHLCYNEEDLASCRYLRSPA